MLDSNRISTYTHKQMIEIKNRLGEIAIIDGTEKQLIITKDLFISGFKCGRDRSKKKRQVSQILTIILGESTIISFICI